MLPGWIERTNRKEDAWFERAAANPKRIILADHDDTRAHEAADRLRKLGLVVPVLLHDIDRFRTDAVRAAADELLDGGAPIDINDPLHVATLMTKVGEADGIVGGASRSTADVLRAGIHVLGTAPGVQVISSSIFFVMPDGRAMVYGDCGVIPDPNAEQLASIAVSSARTFAELTGQEPRVAMLSFSTKGSAEHGKVSKIRHATQLARNLAPDLHIDGELQFDAAWVPAIGENKAPDSTVAGAANVFIFPDLNSGNIAYKITERLGGAKAFGPLLQGVGGVMHDLSRGSSVDDIVNVAVIAALQAQLALKL